jgi:hypothetical protein
VDLNLPGGACFPVESVQPFVEFDVPIDGDFDRLGNTENVLFSLGPSVYPLVTRLHRLYLCTVTESSL